MEDVLGECIVEGCGLVFGSVEYVRCVWVFGEEWVGEEMSEEEWGVARYISCRDCATVGGSFLPLTGLKAWSGMHHRYRKVSY